MDGVAVGVCKDKGSQAVELVGDFALNRRVLGDAKGVIIVDGFDLASHV